MCRVLEGIVMAPSKTNPTKVMPIRCFMLFLFLSSCLDVRGYELQTHSFTKTGEFGNYKMEVTYPSVSGISAAVDYAVNLQIQQAMAGEISSFRRDILLTQAAANSEISTLTITYTAYRLRDRVLSVDLQAVHSFPYAASKAKTVSIQLVINLKSGQRMKLEDVFAESELNNQQLRTYLERKNIDCIPRHVAANTHFLCMPEGLLVKEIECRAEVLLPWSVLRPMMDKEVKALILY